MTDKLKFFSQEWCEAALVAVNANKAVSAGMKDASTFTHTLAFGTTGRKDLVTHMEWVKGQAVSWTSAPFERADIWTIFEADLGSWRECADGVSQGAKLLMAGKIKLAKGPMSAALENVTSINVFLRTWGQLPTDWDV